MGYWASCKELRLVSSYFKPLTHYHLDQYSKFFYLLKSISINYIKSGYAATVLCTVHFGFMSFFFFWSICGGQNSTIYTLLLCLYLIIVLLFYYYLGLSLVYLGLSLFYCVVLPTKQISQYFNNYWQYFHNYWHAQMH